MIRKRKCNSESNSFVAAAEQVCLQPVLEHRQRRGRRNIISQSQVTARCTVVTRSSQLCRSHIAVTSQLYHSYNNCEQGLCAHGTRRPALFHRTRPRMELRAGFKCVEALGRIIITSNAIIYMLVWLSTWSKLHTTQWSTYKLYDIHAIFYSRLSVRKSIFYVFLGNNFFTVFLWRPLSCGGPWATAQFAPPRLKSGPDQARCFQLQL